MQDNFYECALKYAIIFFSNILRKTICTIGLKKYLYGIEERNLNNFLSNGCEDIKSPFFLNRISRVFLNVYSMD